MSLDSIEIPGTPVKVEGSNQLHEIFMFAISTCQWCKKGKRWLNDNGYAYTYLDIDSLKLEVKEDLKSNLRKEFNTRLTFPFLIIDRANFHAGFSSSDWEALLS
ncbi:MAG: glutaredoxin family protein [Candidatus Hodarchaeales archaeon]